MCNNICKRLNFQLLCGLLTFVSLSKTWISGFWTINWSFERGRDTFRASYGQVGKVKSERVDVRMWAENILGVLKATLNWMHNPLFHLSRSSPTGNCRESQHFIQRPLLHDSASFSYYQESPRESVLRFFLCKCRALSESAGLRLVVVERLESESVVLHPGNFKIDGRQHSLTSKAVTLIHILIRKLSSKQISHHHQRYNERYLV